MPRRYADYPDCFYVWNKLSSLGSFITVISVIFFVVILWEAFVAQRAFMFSFHSSVHLDWVYSRLPVRFHSHVESPKIFY
jgi:heme/copper-type cytochrome/quinol oxidase subunit 1